MTRIPTRNDGPFHHHMPEFARHSIEKALSSLQITKKDARLIEEYVAELRATQGIGISRSNKITFALVGWRRFIGPYTKNTIFDLQKGIEDLRNATVNGHPYAKDTIRDYISFLRRMYVWLNENRHSLIELERIKKIRLPGGSTVTVTAEKLLTEEDVAAMVQACSSSRDRALVSVLYESGCRIGEICTLTWGQVKFDQYGAVINVNAKTGRPRYIRITASAPLLAQWQSDCSRFEIRDDSLVFMSARKKPLTYDAVAKQLRIIAGRAGIRKHIRTHLFRQSRVTHLRNQGCSEGVLKQMCWGNPNTKMLAVYSHLTNEDIDKEVLALNGIRPMEPTAAHAMATVQCQRCMSINPPTTNFCGTCGAPLNAGAVADLQQVMEFIESHPRAAELLSQSPA